VILVEISRGNLPEVWCFWGTSGVNSRKWGVLGGLPGINLGPWALSVLLLLALYASISPLMKNMFKNIVLFLLKRFAKRRMKKFKGKVICVTGSVGKTSIKEAIYTVLNSKFRVMKNPGNMNTEFGLPLTILKMESGYSSAVKWSYLLLKGFYKSFRPMYGEVLVVETGVDKPGDMDVLLSIVKPDVAVMNLVAPVHLDEGQFSTLDEIFEEKSKLVKALNEDGFAVLNVDDERVKKLTGGRAKGKTHTFGENPEAMYKATSIEETLEGTSFNLSAEGRRIEAQIPVLGAHSVPVLLPAIVCGRIMGMTLEETLEAAKRMALPPGRLNLIECAVEGAVVVDSSYNSSPKSCVASLKTLSNLKPRSGGRKIAILGNMNELGENAERLHKEVGAHIPDSCDILVTVGKMAKHFAEIAEDKGMKKIFQYTNTQECIAEFKDKIQENDIILVKGSQNNVRLERFVKEVMKYPEQASDLLVRQGKHWQKF
jgi:UDP-N-acetylmuramoyl-tripeptide--D-alanyl-D-alanine ligase